MRREILRQSVVERVLTSCAPADPTFLDDPDFRYPLAVNISNRNICEIPSLLTQGFLEYTDWGYWTVMLMQPSWLGERVWWQIDRHDPERREFKMLQDLCRHADVIHLNGNYDWLHEIGPELEGRVKVVMHHHGGQVRKDPTIAERERDAGWEVLVSTPDLLVHIPWARWLPSPIDLRELDRNIPIWKPRKDRIVVGHGYTIAGNKGTNDIARAVAECSRRDPRIEFMPWNGIQKRLSHWLLSQCDIYVATLLYGPGVATLEAMAMGIPAMCGCSEEELEYQCAVLGVTDPDDLPWIYVTAETLSDRIMDLVNDPDEWEHRAMRARQYVEQWHDVPQVVQRLKAIYEEIKPCRSII